MRELGLLILMGLTIARPCLSSVHLVLPWMYLWDAAPLAMGNGTRDRPRLELPAVVPATAPSGDCAIIYVPGGRYTAYGESVLPQTAYPVILDTCVYFTLFYRLFPYTFPVPLMDMHRSIRLVRSLAQTYMFNPNRIFLIGISVGGHLASMAATLDVSPLSVNPRDPVDSFSSLPNVLIMLAPVTLFVGQYQVPYIKSALLGANSGNSTIDNLVSTCLQISSRTPPTFLFACSGDPDVPVQNSDCWYKRSVQLQLSIVYQRPKCSGHVPTPLVEGLFSSTVLSFIHQELLHLTMSPTTSNMPIAFPTVSPTLVPSSFPTSAFPSVFPSAAPFSTSNPTSMPRSFTTHPTEVPSSFPTISLGPTPTTATPVSRRPSRLPTTARPHPPPSRSPVSRQPSNIPTSAEPTTSYLQSQIPTFVPSSSPALRTPDPANGE